MFLLLLAAPAAAQVPTPHQSDGRAEVEVEGDVTPEGGRSNEERDREESGGDDDGGPSLALVAVAAVAGAAVGAGASGLLRSRQQPTSSAGTAGSIQPVAGPSGPPAIRSAPATAPGGSPPGASDGAERATLVQALIEVGDLVTSDALRTQVAERLAAVGVSPILAAPGDAFDPTLHRGVQALPAPTAAQDGTVASCDRAGWSDRGQRLRPPEVVVFRWTAP